MQRDRPPASQWRATLRLNVGLDLQTPHRKSADPGKPRLSCQETDFLRSARTGLVSAEDSYRVFLTRLSSLHRRQVRGRSRMPKRLTQEKRPRLSGRNLHRRGRAGYFTAMTTSPAR